MLQTIGIVRAKLCGKYNNKLGKPARFSQKTHFEEENDRVFLNVRLRKI